MSGFATGNRKKFEVPSADQPAQDVAPVTVLHAPQAPDNASPEEKYYNDVEAVASSESAPMDSFSASDSASPQFTVVDVNTEILHEYAREYEPNLAVKECVANIVMLLTYMVTTERKLGVTLSMRAYGVDPVVFEEASKDTPDGQPRVVAITVPGKESTDGYEGDLYELIDVDGVLYLSCVSESLNPNYLHQVIAEATEAVYTHGRYVYTMVGPRPLANDGSGKNEFIETLKLNSYELSVLLSYMNKLSGVHVSYGVYNGRSAILFERD